MLKNFKIYFLCSFFVLSLSLGQAAIIIKKNCFDMVNEILCFNSEIPLYGHCIYNHKINLAGHI